MNLLLKRNYNNLDIDDSSSELISVKTEDNSDWEHIQFDGFIAYSQFMMLALPERKVACSGYRESFKDAWQYIDKDQYAVGVVIDGKIYVVERDGRPLLGSDPKLNHVKRDKKDNVVRLFGKR